MKTSSEKVNGARSEQSALPAKQESHGRIGEAAVRAKCWMNGIRAYDTAGLRANFAHSDLLIETTDPRRPLWVQVKSGYPVRRDSVYLTQCLGESDREGDKFAADFVVFVNLEPSVAKAHDHDGSLKFEHLSFFVMPQEPANELFRRLVNEEEARPKRDGGKRSLQNMAVDASAADMNSYRDAWQLIRLASGAP